MTRDKSSKTWRPLLKGDSDDEFNPVNIKKEYFETPEMFQLFDNENDYNIVGWSTSMNKLVIEKMENVNYEGKYKSND